MAFRRTNLSEFSLESTIYSNATVTIFGVTSGGLKDTGNVVTVFDDITGSTTLANPQTLNSRGQWPQPVYVDEAVILQITGLSAADHDTGIIFPIVDDKDIALAEFKANQADGAAIRAQESAREARVEAAAAAASAASLDDQQIALVAQSYS